MEDSMADTPDKTRPSGDEPEETLAQREQRLERQRVGPEDEVRASPDGPASQITPDVEPAGS
jgi:hypothetical protein